MQRRVAAKGGSKAPAKASAAKTVAPPIMGISKGAGEVEVETTRDLLVQIRSILQRFDDEASANVGARRDTAISDIGLSCGTVAKQITFLRGLLKANSQLAGLNSELAAVLRGGGVFYTHFTENHDAIYDKRAKRTLFIASNGGYPQNSRLVKAWNDRLMSVAHEECVKAGR